MSWIFQRRIKLFGGLGLNVSKSGVSWGFRSMFGSVGKNGYSIRTGIPGLSWRERWSSKRKEKAAAVLQRKAERLEKKMDMVNEQSEALESFDFSLNENNIPKFWANVAKDFRHIRIVCKGPNQYSLGAEGMSTDDGTAQQALVELATLKAEFKRMKTTLQSNKKLISQNEVVANQLISMMEPIFAVIKILENHIKKAIESA